MASSSPGPESGNLPADPAGRPSSSPPPPAAAPSPAPATNGDAADLSPLRFARELWGIAPPSQAVEFFFLRERPLDEEGKAQKPQKQSIFYTVDQVLTDYATIGNFLQVRNGEIWNVHHSVNPRFQMPLSDDLRKGGRSKNADVAAFVALWADIDWHSGDEAGVRTRVKGQLAELEAAGLAPSIRLESGYGLHFYWLLDRPYPVDPKKETGPAREACAGLQDYFKIADAINDGVRVLRWPGTANHRIKGVYPLCRIVEASWRRYPLGAFDAYRIDPGPTVEARDRDQAEKEIRTQLAKFKDKPSKDPEIERIKAGVDEGERNLAAAKIAGHYFGRGWAREAIVYAMRQWNGKNRPPLDESELFTVIDSIEKKESKKTPEERKAGRGRPEAVPNVGAIWFDENGKFNPKVMASHIAGNHRFLATPIGKDGRGVDLYLYREGAFRSEEGADFARSEINRLLGSASRAGRINESVELLTESTKIHFRKVNPRARELVNLQNGMLDWKKGVLLDHSPDHLSTIQLPVAYDPNAKCEALDKFFADVFPADAIPLVEEFVGYLMVPDTRYQKCFIAVGSGSNGKSTFLKILEHFLGKDNTSSLTIHEIEEDRFALINLVGRLANICHDLDPHILESTGKFKRLVTGDPLTTEDKFKSSFRFTPFARLVFAANEFPRSTDKTEGYTRRLMFVPFTKVFNEASGRIPDYDKVLAETPGFLPALLNRAIAGLQRLNQRGDFTMCESVRKAVERYKRDCNSALDFVMEFCTFGDGWISRHDLFEPYKEWCLKEGMKPMSAKTLAAALRTVKGVFEHKNEVLGWKGLLWKDGKKPVTNLDDARAFEAQIGGGNDRNDTDF